MNSTSEIEKLFDFICFSSRLRDVTRHNNGSVDRLETVAEHSWHLALICWVLHKTFEEELGKSVDLSKMIKMCLMHDLVEVDAGDPSAWLATEANKSSKQELERVSAIKRFGGLPVELSQEFLELWSECEAAQSPEARLVKAVDRFNPALMRYLTKQGWRDVKATPMSLDALQLPRISFSPVLTGMYRLVKDLAITEGLLAEHYP
jgi:putative hydrolases of HD superfamily